MHGLTLSDDLRRFFMKGQSRAYLEFVRASLAYIFAQKRIR
jgi:hypothetical protein